MPDKADQDLLKPKFWSLHAVRLRIALMLSLVVIAVAMSRNSLSMAMVCMVNSSMIPERLVVQQDGPQVQAGLIDHRCPEMPSSHKSYSGGTFQWTGRQQDTLFSAIYWGSLISGLPGGILADMWGGKTVISICLLGQVFCTALIPLATYEAGFGALFMLRFMNGIFGQAVVMPAIGVLIANWIPVSEKSTVIAICTAGNQIANMIAMPLNAFLCQQKHYFGGWPAIFYTCSAVGLIVVLLWQAVVSDKPEQNAWTSASEIELLNALHSQTGGNRFKVSFFQLPWRHLLLSAPMISINVSNFTNQLVTTTMVTYLPMYFKDALHFDLRQNGYVSALPYVAQLVSKLLCAHTADAYKRRHGNKDATKISKIFNTTGTLGAGIFLITLSTTDCRHPTVAVLLMVTANAFISGVVPGFMTSTLSVAPAYSGTVSSISKFTGQMAAALTPHIVGSLVKRSAANSWYLVFVVSGCSLILSGIVYLLYGSCEIQQWAVVRQRTSVDKPIDE